MARRCAVFTGPASSTGSPTTLMMRPRHSSPTGTEIGCPVSVTSWPRTRPSLVSIATVRTVDSPRCCATSSTRRLPPFVVSSAFRIAGRSPSNCTSTTAPMTWVIFPTALVGVAMPIPFTTPLSDRSTVRGTPGGQTSRSSYQPSLAPLAFAQSRHSSLPYPATFSPCSLGSRECGPAPRQAAPRSSSSQRLGAGDDLDQLFGDHRLAGAVVRQGLLADHLARIAGGVIHGAHLRAIERCSVLQKRAEDLHRDVARQELRENLFFVRLILVDSRGSLAGCRFEHRWNDLLGGRDLGDHRLEAGEEQRADIERALRI